MAELDDNQQPATAPANGQHHRGTKRLVFRRGFNPAYWIGVFGFCVLLGTFWIPIASAQRTARVEKRGQILAEELLWQAVAMAPVDLGSEADRMVLFARVLRACEGVIFVEDLELLDPIADLEAVTLANKHYVIQLWRSPRREATLEPLDGSGAVPLEALAWPRNATGPAHAAFFVPEDSAPAFTRNLQSNYHGLDPDKDWPIPGESHRRPDARRARDYRDFADNRWLLLGMPPRVGR